MELGAETAEQALPRIRSQHIRFLAESRSATPLRVDCGVVRREGDTIELLSLMHHNLSGDVLAAFVTTLDVAGWPIGGEATPAVAVPEYAQPRGVQPDQLPAPPTSLAAAHSAGFRTVGRGVIAAEECDEAGLALPHVYIGRISDGMPNLWAFMNTDAERTARESGELGGAALEQRLVVHAPLTRGSVFRQLSGVRALGNKTQHMAHLLYDETAGRIAVTAEAVGVAMDLTTRRAVAISPERRARLEPLLLR
jgi:acyl-CoA thioesterase FadM